MRSVVVSICLMTGLTGCATVSMVPGQASVETNLTSEQSALREASDAYVKKAEAEQWVQASSSWLGIARVLVDGVSGDDDKPKNYSELIEAETAPTSEVYMRLAADIERARDGLEGVTQEASVFIASGAFDEKSLRKDVTSYERVLVTAQKSRRNFAEALGVVANRSADGAKMAEGYLEAFDLAIDEARRTADNLAELYASAPTSTATS